MIVCQFGVQKHSSENNLCNVELEARENAAVQKAAKEKPVKEQQAKDAAKQLEQEVRVCYLYVFRSLYTS